jgi:MFS family permease
MAGGYFKSGEGQTVLLGLVFLFVFMAYYMIQSYSANLYGSVLGGNMETTLYAVFTVFCFPAPAICNKLGTRATMFLGILGYAALVATSLLYYLGAVGAWGVVAGGGVNGVGAALLWTAQGRLMLQYSDGKDAGRIFALFWSIFNASAVFGGLLTFAYFSSNSSDGNVALFVIFLGLILVGACGALLLAPPEAVAEKRSFTEEDGGSPTNPLQDPLWSSEGGYSSGVAGLLASDASPPRPPDAEVSSASWVDELGGTLALFLEPRMARFTAIFFYTGFNQPYQLVTFGDRFFTPPALGLATALFFGAEVAGAFVSARVVDAAGKDDRSKAVTGYTVFFAVTTVGYLLALLLELPRMQDPDHVPSKNSAWNVVPAGLAMALWGFADAQIQAQAYWQLGTVYTTGAKQARAVGFFKFVQSAGWCVGFALSPSSRLAPVLQLAATAACYVLGLALLELPKAQKPSEAPRGKHRSLAVDC